MKTDHLSFKRAATVSLIGLGIQAVLGSLMLIYGVLGSDAAASTAAYAMLVSLPIWASLALVFHQHRLERLEAMENEAYATSTAAQASVFEQSGGDTQAQAERLAWMHKWFLPSASLVVAAGFIGVGLARFFQTRGQLADDSEFAAPEQAGWAISLGVGVAVIGFIFARFVAGMAKQRAWALLHAGSGSAVSAALMAGALAIVHFIKVAAREETALRYLAPVLALFMVALGAEVILNFILNLYRPRVAGEYQRPAFDSRVLAFIAAPDRLAESISDAINYQFGFNVSATWFYRLMARSIAALAVLGGLVTWALSIFTVVPPNERALLMRNGRLVRVLEPGLAVDLPWPFARVERFPADAANRIQVGTPPPDQEGPILWTNEHTLNETFMLVQPPGGQAAAQPGDLNLLAVEIPIHYTVQDVLKYKGLAQDGPRGKEDQMRRDLLTAEASRVVVKFLAAQSVDDVLGPSRAGMSERLRGLVQEAFDRLDAGVEVLFVGTAGTHPEKSVAPAFEAVVKTDQRRLAEVEKAEADAIKTLAAVVGDVDRARLIIAELDALERLKAARAQPEEIIGQEQKVDELVASAGGEAASMISEARAARWEMHLKARGAAAASEGLVASYRAAPLPFKMARYLATLREGSANARVWIIPSTRTRVSINYEEQEPIVSGFAPDKPADR